MAKYLDTGKKVLTDVLFRASESVLLTGDVSDYLDAVKRYIMRAYQFVLTFYPFPFALKDPPGIIDTKDEQTITTACTNQNAVVVTSGSLSGSVVGYKFYALGDDTRYRVITHAGNNVTLDATWKSATGSYTGYFYKDEYDLASDCLKP